VSVAAGQLFIYRVFDVAQEIDLPAVETALRSGPAGARVRIAPGKPQSLIVRNAPIRLALGETELPLPLEKPVKAETTATVWDYGAISVRFQIDISGLSQASLSALSERLTGPTELNERLDAIGRKRADEVLAQIRPALRSETSSSIVEDYVVYFLQQIEGARDADEVRAKIDLPALLYGETREVLSERSREAAHQGFFQYATDDFIMIDWNSAIIYEAHGERDTLDVLEFALTQLLEFRYYDDLLDRRLASVYDAIEAGRERVWRDRFGKVMREANTRFLEFSEFTERVDNSLKAVGDFYLATVFRGAVRRFRIPDWQGSVTRKMNTLAQVSGLLQGEMNVRRSHLLEAIVILLILFEVVSAGFRATH
jgi:hypothetical protein